MIVLCDKGPAGKVMERYVTDQFHVALDRPDRKDERRRFGNLAGMRQWIEAIIGTPKDQLDLVQHGARPRRGLHPHRPAAARPGRMHLAQLGHWSAKPALSHRIRPLKINRNQ